MEPDRHVNQPTVHTADNHGTSPSLAGRLSVFHNTIVQALKDLQPLVVLFSLTVAVASLLRTPFPDASTWALAASLGFGWALLFSVLIRLAPPLGAFGSLASIYHLLVDVGVLLGFVALGAALYLLSQVNGLLNSAYVFLVTEALSLAIAPSAHRLWTGGLARATGTKSWAASFVGWSAITLLIVAVGSPWFILLTRAGWRAGLPIVIWAIDFPLLLIVVEAQWLFVETRHATVRRGS